MGGFRDYWRLLLGWWSSPVTTAATPVTVYDAAAFVFVTYDRAALPFTHFDAAAFAFTAYDAARL